MNFHMVCVIAPRQDVMRNNFFIDPLTNATANLYTEHLKKKCVDGEMRLAKGKFSVTFEDGEVTKGHVVELSQSSGHYEP